MLPVSTSSPIFAARSLPIPGRARRWASVREATGVGSWATVSDAFRYARILKGFSPLISSRSPISASTRAMARFSLTRRGGCRGASRRARCGTRGFSRPRRRGGRGGRGHARREPLAVLPLFSDLTSNGGPVAALERGAHRGGNVADAAEAGLHVAVAVDV